MYTVSSTLRSTTTKDGTVVLDVEHGLILRCNQTALFILRHLEQGRNKSEIVKTISEEFGAAPELVERDISDFLQTLERYGLLVPAIPRNENSHED
jgi:hypothetical protein